MSETDLDTLAADTELLDQLKISLAVALGDVTQQAAALADHLQQATTGHVIVLIGLEMLGDLLDAFRQNCHLGASATGVVFVYLRAFDSGGLFLSCNHVQVF
jgi:hypothetical protein